MNLFSCYDIFPDEETKKKRVMEIDAIAYRRNKAVENKIRLAKSAIENYDMEMAYAAMNIDTTIAEMLDRMDPDERRRALEDARQSAKEQQERSVICRP